MKIFFTLLLCCLISCMQQEIKSKVYITNTGSKYHNGSCIYVEENRIPISLEDAVQRYTPCEKCNPPVYHAVPVFPDSASAPSSDTSAVQTKSVRCNAFTKKGKRCKRMTPNANGKCFQHNH